MDCFNGYQQSIFIIKNIVLLYHILMGAGVLPYTVNHGKPLFLFGKEQSTNDTPGWADFGGGAEGKETDRTVALREWYEETSGVFGTFTEYRALFTKGFVCTFTNTSRRYTVFLVRVPYDQAVATHYNRISDFFEQSALDTRATKGLFEKARMEWFSVADMRRRRRQFRSYYQDLVGLVVDWAEGDGGSRGNGMRKRTRKKRRRAVRGTHGNQTRRN
jgi:8-oxo-dGTP pyrophosphatase MutT (NUDIX family)